MMDGATSEPAAASTTAKKPRGQHPHQRLTPVRVRSLRAPGRYADGNGLYLVVDPSGARRWIWRGVVRGKRCDLGLGPIALCTLAEARLEAVRCKKLARSGGDPRRERAQRTRQTPTFAEAAERVHAAHSAAFRNEKHKAQWLASLKAYVFPAFGQRSVDAIDAADVLRALSPLWTTKPETARRLRQRVRVVLGWAKASGFRAGDNPVDGITKVLPRVRQAATHHPALPYADVPAFVTALRSSDAGTSSVLAFEFLILTATRTSEVLGARWDEVDQQNQTWTIPANRIKAGRPHRIPLSARCLQILERAGTLTDGGPLIFPGRSSAVPLSNMVFLMALRRLNYAHVTAHGFRSAFRDWAAERTSVPRTVCEAALAHVVKDKSEAAYFRSDLFDLRRDLMASWAQFATGEPARLLAMRGGRHGHPQSR